MPESVADQTECLLRSYGGDEPHEGIVYLGGREASGGSVVCAAFAPSATTSWGSFRTERDANADLLSALARLNLTLVAQVHSHPGSWVDHSDGDDEGAIVRFAGYWSVVVPDFAREGMRPLHTCGIHLFQGGEFRRLTEEAVHSRVHLVPAGLDLRS